MRVLVAVAACLGAVACTATGRADVTDRPHAILLVTLSSTRADRLGPYGFPRPRTATLDALSATGTTWLRAYSATPETLSSHATLMTGTYPPTHGVRDGTRADPLVPTLAERLRADGWQTAAFTGAMSTHRHLGVLRGFETVTDRLGPLPSSLEWPRQRTAEHVVTEAARFLETADSSEPLLVWVHLYDPHWPHQPPDAWLEDVGDPYEAEIAYTDWELGRLVRAWDAVIGPQGGWVVVTADHGTGLGEGGEQTQGYLLHDATLHVPLIARGPGITAGHRDDSLVSHIDVVPTLLDLAGLPDAPEVQGRDLRYGGSDGAYHEAMLGQYTLGLAPLRAVTVEDGRVTEGTWTGWYPSLGTWVGPDAERLEPDDPRIERVRAMRASLGTGRMEGRPMDSQTTAMLAGLGYATTGDPDAGPGSVDPRDVGDALPLLFRARERLAGSLLHRADALQAELSQRLPASHGLTALDADIDHRRGRLDRARATWEARHHEVATPASAMRVAELAAALGDFDSAAAWYEEVLVDQPTAPEALAGLARSAWMQGEDDRAESVAARMLVLAPDDPQTAAVYAESLLRGGQLDAAVDEALAAHEMMPWSPWPSHVVGGVLWQRGLAEQAVDELRRAVEKDPWQAAVRLRLADFLLEMGRNHEAVRALAPLAAAAPDEPRIQGAYEAARMAMTMDEKHDIRRKRALGPSGLGVVMEAPRIETERLVLTWPTPQQIDGYYAAIIGTELFDTLLWDGPSSDQEMHDYWILRRSEGNDPTKAFSVSIIEKATDACIGGASLRPVDGDPAILDVGYALAPAFHGRGYGTEAVGALIHEGFANRGAERVFATIFVGNTASARLCEKLGMQLEGTLRRAVLKRGTWRDEWLYAITRPDWEGHRV